MSTFAMNETTKDFLFENGDIVLVTGAEEVRQILLSRLRTFRGEWFLDTTVGVPYFEEILVKDPSISRADSTLKDIILTTPGVIELQEFTFSYDNSLRQLKLDIKVLAQDGEFFFINEVL